MRVILTVPSLSPRFGGPTIKAIHLSSSLKRLGLAVEVIGGDQGEVGTSLGALWSYRGTPFPRHIKVLLRAVEAADLVHVIGYRDPVGSFSAFAAHHFGTPVILEPVGMYARHYRNQQLKAAFDISVGQFVARRCVLIVATSRQEFAELKRAGIGPERIRLRPNGVDLAGIWPLPARGLFRRRFGIPPSAPLVLTLARFSGIKQLDTLVAALARTPDVWAVISGPDSQDGTSEKLMRMREALALQRRVILIRSGLWGREKAEALADADMFCLPSLTESFGTAAAEAAAVGIPVIASIGCGVAEWLDVPSHRLIQAGDVEAVARSIRDLSRDRSSRSAARQAANQIRQQLSWSRLGQVQKAMYEEAVRLHKS